MKQVLVLGGLTATGKSELAIKWAQAFHGEIISVDSVALYKQLNIAAAKLKENERGGIIHHGIDISDVENPYSVKDFVDYARQMIDAIHNRGKLPILVGGSGLYLKAILYDYDFESESTQDSQIYDNQTNEVLHEKLKAIDPDQAELIHLNNRKRVIRALMIAKTHNQTKSELIAQQKQVLRYDALIFIMDGNRQRLYERINHRVDKMVEVGLMQEVKKASQRADWSLSSMSAIGVKEWRAYFEGQEPLDQVIETIKTKTRQLSKRQRTWFKHQFDGIWLDFEDEVSMQDAKVRIKQWIVPLDE